MQRRGGNRRWVLTWQSQWNPRGLCSCKPAQCLLEAWPAKQEAQSKRLVLETANRVTQSPDTVHPIPSAARHPLAQLKHLQKVSPTQSPPDTHSGSPPDPWSCLLSHGCGWWQSSPSPHADEGTGWAAEEGKHVHMGKGGKKGAAAPHTYTCTHTPCYEIFSREVLESWTCRQTFPSSWRSVEGKVNFYLLWVLEKSLFQSCSNPSVSPETYSKLTTFFLS